MDRINQTDRSAQLRALEGQQFDLLVIGGGITGVGVARDAAIDASTVDTLIDGASRRSTRAKPHTLP